MMGKEYKTKKNALKRVKEIKGYYRHIIVFIVINGFLYLLKIGALNSFLPDNFPRESYYYDWINANIFIWAVILVIHTLILQRHRFTFFKKWEERQIQKYMDEDRSEVNKYK